MAVLLFVAPGVACGGGDDGNTDTDIDIEVDTDVVTSDRAVTQVTAADIDNAELAELKATYVDVESQDRRPALLAELGGPDAFVITVDEIAGTVSRFESWSYFAEGTQIDLVDGEVLWDVAIEVLPDGTWLPLMYDPREFTMLASKADTLAAIADVTLARLDSDVDIEVDGAEVWAGEQLVLAFVDDRLVYVESFPLAPGDQELAG